MNKRDIILQKLNEFKEYVNGLTVDDLEEKEEEEEKETGVKPVFPMEGCVLFADGMATSGNSGKDKCKMLQGNTFYTFEDAQKEAVRREAEVRVREQINLVNKGDNGFKCGRPNYVISWTNIEQRAFFIKNMSNQQNSSWEYIRTHKAWKLLIKDDKFITDWKLMKGIPQC